jgi:SAM-dependent methyltransferase
MDYDAYDIAEIYDRARALLPATARLWQELLADYIDLGATPLILDLGCGTGRFSELCQGASRLLDRAVRQARGDLMPGRAHPDAVVDAGSGLRCS